MREIQGKSILVRISARFELSGVNCICVSFKIVFSVSLQFLDIHGGNLLILNNEAFIIVIKKVQCFIHVSCQHLRNVAQVPSSDLSRSFCSAINITSSQEFRVFQTGKGKASAKGETRAMGASVTRASCSMPASRQKNARIENNVCCTFKILNSESYRPHLRCIHVLPPAWTERVPFLPLRKQ